MPVPTRRTIAWAVGALAAVLALTALALWLSGVWRGSGSPSASVSSMSASSAAPSPSVESTTPGAHASTPAVATPTPSVQPPAASAPAGTPKPSPSRAVTAVTVTFSGWQPSTASVLVGGYAAVVESGGSCTLVLTRNNVVVTAKSDASPDASTTSCGALEVAGTALTAGQWTGTLRYESAITTGESTPITIEVPR